LKVRDTNHYRHPHHSWIGRMAAALANSVRLARLRRSVMSRLPFLKLESDVRDVVYLTWLIDAATAQDLLPAGVSLWQRNGKTPFTVLTYRHGHFGPAFLGPLRRLFPSPLQSNWRFYLAGENGTVFFVKNVMNSWVHALGTRVFSDVLQTHLAAEFSHRGDGTRFESRISSGQGSSPSLACVAQLDSGRQLPADFAALFDDWEQAVEFLACQHKAIALDGRGDRLAESEISLPIDVADVLPLTAGAEQVHCSLLDRLKPAGAPFCFLVPAVQFGVLSEHLR
jgi:hypothetical protein